jgi:hypothetical protein
MESGLDHNEVRIEDLTADGRDEAFGNPLKLRREGGGRVTMLQTLPQLFEVEGGEACPGGGEVGRRLEERKEGSKEKRLRRGRRGRRSGGFGSIAHGLADGRDQA